MEILIFGRWFSFLSEEAQWDKLNSMLSQYFYTPATILALIAAVVCFFYVKKGIKCILNKEIESEKYKKIVLIGYIVIFFSFSFFNRDVTNVRVLRLTFDSWIASNRTYHESNILIAILDTLYFVPYGAIVKWKRWNDRRIYSFIVSIGIILLTGFTIEFLQYFFFRGVASVEDLIAYLTGGSIGIIVVSILEQKYIV